MAKMGSTVASSLLVLLVLPSLIPACNPPDSLPDSKASQMSLSCFRTTDPNIRSVDLLYDANSDVGHIWAGNGATPHCSSTSKPAPSSCQVCSIELLHVVCCSLSKSTMLVMEGAGQHIDLVQSECPQLLTEDTNQNSDPGNHPGGPRWRLPILVLSLSLIMIIGR